MKIQRLNEQFAQTFSGDGFNSSNGVFKVKYKAFDDLSQPKGREINPYDHVKGEEFQVGDVVLVKLRGKKSKKKIQAVIVSTSRTDDGKTTNFKVRSVNTNKVYNVPVFAIEFLQDRGNVIRGMAKTGGSAISNKAKFLTSLKYNAGNFVWGSLESKQSDRTDILLKEGSKELERPGIIDPSVQVALIDSDHPDYKKHIENFKRMGIVYNIPEEKKIFIHKGDSNFSKLNDNHILAIEALQVAKMMTLNETEIDEKYNDVLAAQILRNKGYKEAYKIIASNFESRHGISYGEITDSLLPKMKHHLFEDK